MSFIYYCTNINVKNIVVRNIIFWLVDNANVFHEFYVVDKCVCGRQRHVHWLLAYASCLRLLPAQ